MTRPQATTIDRRSVGRRERIAARLVVVAARLLAGRSPRLIQRILGRISRGVRPASYAEASRARTLVTATSWACAGPDGCLPRSVATCLLCRIRGCWPTWCVGVRVMPPFGAHAWVRAEDRDVDEPFPADYHRVLLTVPHFHDSRSAA